MTAQMINKVLTHENRLGGGEGGSVYFPSDSDQFLQVYSS